MATERTLFDEPEELHSNRPTDSLWRECPLEVFLAMSELQQLDYCARRDEDSARFADSEEDAAWYRARAKWYRDEMERLQR